MNTFAYIYNKKVYINLTNKCTNSCEFCIRDLTSGVGSANSLWLSREPNACEALNQLADLEFNEAVFCGYGEPTEALEVLLDVAKALKNEGKKVRLNTNGQGSLINGYNIAKELAECIDEASISLNASSKEKYNQLCKPKFINAYDAVLEFAKDCLSANIKTILSVVDTAQQAEIEECRKIAVKLGADFRVRRFGE